MLLLSNLKKNLFICIFTFIYSMSAYALSNNLLLQDARKALSQGEFKAAIIHIKNILKTQPDNLTARELLIDYYIHVGDGVSAEIEINKLLDSGVKNTYLLIARIRANLLQGHFKAVTDQVNNIARLPPNDIGRIRALQGQAYLNQNKVSEAKNFFLRASKLAPNTFEVQVGLARLYELNNEMDKADQLINQLEQQYPYEVDVLLLAGNKYRRNNQYTEAYTVFEKARKIQPGNIAAWLGSIGALIANNDYDKANQYIIQVLKLDPEHELANHLQAIIAYQLKQYPTVEQSLRIIEKNNPNNKDILWLSGSLDFQQQRYQEAEDKLKEFVELHPRHLPAIKTLSAVYLKRKQGYKVVQLLSPYAQSQDVQVMGLLGSAYALAGNKEKGSFYLERAVQLSPENKKIKEQLMLGKITSGQEITVDFDDPDFNNFEGVGIIHILNLLRKKQTDSAIELLTAYNKKIPDNAIIYNMLGSAYLQNKDTGKAIQFFNHSIKLDHQFLLPRINLARLNIQEKKYKEAKKLYLAILEMAPENETVLIDLAGLSQIENDEKGMLRWLNTAAKLNSSSVKPRYLLNQYYYGKKDFEKALLASSELIELQPENVTFLKSHADNLLALNRLYESIGIYKRITQIKPQFSITWQWLGSAQYLFKNYKDSEVSFNKALEFYASNSVARAAIIKIALSQQNLEEANKHAQLFIKNSPQLPLAYESAGDVSVAMRQPEKALNYYKTALDLKDNPNIIIKIHQIYRILGQNEKAEKSLENWLIKYPNDIKTRMITALIYLQHGNLNKSQSHYEFVISKQPQNINAINNLALIYDQTNDPRNIEFAEIAYSLNPDAPHINDTLGWILLKNGEKERAVKLLKYAAKGSPSDFEILYHYAVALYETGEKKEAKRQLYMIVPIKKDFPGRKKAEQLLEKLKREQAL